VAVWVWLAQRGQWAVRCRWGRAWQVRVAWQCLAPQLGPQVSLWLRWGWAL